MVAAYNTLKSTSWSSMSSNCNILYLYFIVILLMALPFNINESPRLFARLTSKRSTINYLDLLDFMDSPKLISEQFF
jgi:hypothetical protein